jgi:hypothetical protein
MIISEVLSKHLLAPSNEKKKSISFLSASTDKDAFCRGKKPVDNLVSRVNSSVVFFNWQSCDSAATGISKKNRRKCFIQLCFDHSELIAGVFVNLFKSTTSFGFCQSQLVKSNPVNSAAAVAFQKTYIY